MPGKSPGRNDPCPCGSGKKYKKCCLEKETVAPDLAPRPKLHSPPPGILYEDDVDQLSNSAVDAIQKMRYEEAERLCEQLLRDFPTLIDGHDRLAMLREAQERFGEAAHHYGRALELMAKEPADYDPELVTLFKERRRRALAKSSPSP